MYSQTVAYGLFYARTMDTDGHFELSEVVDLIPSTNPFLKELLKKCFDQGYSKASNIDFDELEIGEIVKLLNQTDTDEILKDFGRRTGGGTEDPVIHFYEGFLNEYEKDQKKERGVFYTPDPVVEFIVNTVDFLLRKDFSYEQGLNDTSYKKVKTLRDSKKKNTKGLYSLVEDSIEVPAIQILDPATGTGTFLKYVIQLIKKNFDQFNKGKNSEELKAEWNRYVSENLLQRLYGFEIMMAPYAVAHMKLGLLLKETGYEFKDNERLQILLTNALEEPDSEKRTIFNFDALSEESDLANRIKNNKSINVVIGNPPYLAQSTNENQFIRNLLRGIDLEGNKTGDYFTLNGQSLGERNPRWINDDYVKFIRLGQFMIDRAEAGILAFITNHGYLYNPTFRGMREELLKSFNDIYIIDLHGNSKYREVSPDGSKDENVFNIQQGVAIAIFVKSNEIDTGKANIYHSEVWGNRESKFKWLKDNTLESIKWNKLNPMFPNYLFVPQNDELYNEYISSSWKITDIFPVNSVGIVTARDHFVLQWTPDETWRVINDFIKLPVETAREKYQLRADVRDWKVSLAQQDLKQSSIDKNKIVPFLYRPFDIRYTYYTGKSRGFMCMPRPEVMTHLINIKDNLSLLTARSNKSSNPNHFFCSRFISEAKSAESTTQSACFPLYLYEPNLENLASNKRPNISAAFIDEIKTKLNLKLINEGKGDLVKTIGPEDVFSYIYSIFYSNSYRETYGEFLKSDFPRISITSDIHLFSKLVQFGDELVKLHLMESNLTSTADFSDQNNCLVEKVSYKKGSGIWINKTSYFSGVDREVWDFEIGGYPVCKKWLNYRKGKELEEKEIEQFKQIVAIIKQTRILMIKIDSLINDMGGWPLKSDSIDLDLQNVAEGKTKYTI